MHENYPHPDRWIVVAVPIGDNFDYHAYDTVGLVGIPCDNEDGAKEVCRVANDEDRRQQ